MTGVQTCALPILRELRGVRADYRKGFGALVDQTKSPLVSMMETKRETIRRLEQQIRDIKLQIKAAKRGDLDKVASDLDDMMKAIKGEKELLSSEFARNIDSIKGEIEGLDAKKEKSMLKFLKKLISPEQCQHDWEPITKIKTFIPATNTVQMSNVFKCKHCPKLRKG